MVDSEGKSEGLVTERDIVTKICINDTGASSITMRHLLVVGDIYKNKPHLLILQDLKNFLMMKL